MKISQNNKEIISLLFNLSIESIKVLMACLLILFVPQKCDDHECNFQEKLEDTNYRYAFGFNIFTLLICLTSYYKEFSREKFMIVCFNVNKQLPDNNLRHIIDKTTEPTLMKILNHNKSFYKFTLGAIIISIINFVLSGVFIVLYHYDGYKTITSLATNVLLMSKTLSSNYSISKKSYDNSLALSTAHLEPLCYNDIEPRLKQLFDLDNKMEKLEKPTIIYNIPDEKDNVEVNFKV